MVVPDAVIENAPLRGYPAPLRLDDKQYTLLWPDRRDVPRTLTRTENNLEVDGHALYDRDRTYTGLLEPYKDIPGMSMTRLRGVFTAAQLTELESIYANMKEVYMRVVYAVDVARLHEDYLTANMSHRLNHLGKIYNTFLGRYPPGELDTNYARHMWLASSNPYVALFTFMTDDTLRAPVYAYINSISDRARVRVIDVGNIDKPARVGECPLKPGINLVGVASRSASQKWGHIQPAIAVVDAADNTVREFVMSNSNRIIPAPHGIFARIREMFPVPFANTECVHIEAQEDGVFHRYFDRDEVPYTGGLCATHTVGIMFLMACLIKMGYKFSAYNLLLAAEAVMYVDYISQQKEYDLAFRAREWTDFGDKPILPAQINLQVTSKMSLRIIAEAAYTRTHDFRELMPHRDARRAYRASIFTTCPKHGIPILKKDVLRETLKTKLHI